MSILITNRHRSPVKMKMKQGIPNFEESEQKQLRLNNTWTYFCI